MLVALVGCGAGRRADWALQLFLAGAASPRGRMAVSPQPRWLTHSGQPCAFQSSRSLKCYGIFLCFNKCVFTNVSSGENIFLSFFCVASLGLSVEVKPIVLALALFFPCPVLFSSLFFGEEINVCF